MLVPMSPADSMFLLGESARHPMHVGGLMLFTPPEGGEAADIRAMLDAALERETVAPRLRHRARRSVTTLGQWGWDTDVDVDIAYHVRHSALPHPGRMAELLTLVSRLHAGLLDRGRPLWEMHLIEGLADGRFAIYTKIHHALADGVAAMAMLRRCLSENATDRDLPAPWEPRRTAAGPTAGPSAGLNPLGLPAAALRAARDTVGEIAGLVPALAGTVDRALHKRGGALSLAAPKTLFNVPIGASRRFAGHSWPLERLRMIAKHGDATINDVVLAMCSGALRSYLHARDALPEAPLIAMVPVSLRGADAGEDGGNQIGMLMCNLATHLADPARRLDTVRTSMHEGKRAMRSMSQAQTMASTALGATPLALGMLGLAGPVRPPNLVISNVPGPDAPMYWNGARLAALYPLSFPVDGQALNITCTSTHHEISFGLTGCRRAVPGLADMLGHLDEQLNELEMAVVP